MVELKEVLFDTHNQNFNSKPVNPKNTKIYRQIAGILSLLGILYTLFELILLRFNASICSSQGCKLVGHFAKYGEWLIVVLGVIYFALLFLSIAFKYKDTLLISLGLAVEGYLLGFQLFIIHNICYFCLGVFLIIFAISVLYLFTTRFKITDYAYMFAILLMVYLIHTPYLNIGSNGNYLFYSPTCPHCHKTIAYLKSHKIPFKPINANECQAFLNTFGINQVPCLIQKKNNDNILMIVGEENIESYFAKNNSVKKPISVNKANTSNLPQTADIGSITVTAKRINTNSTQKATNSTNATSSVSTAFANYGFGYGNNTSTQACTIGENKCK